MAVEKGHLSVHLKMPKSKLQWKLQQQLQQKLEQHPELADTAQTASQAVARHLLQLHRI